MTHIGQKIRLEGTRCKAGTTRIVIWRRRQIEAPVSLEIGTRAVHCLRSFAGRTGGDAKGVYELPRRSKALGLFHPPGGEAERISPGPCRLCGQNGIISRAHTKRRRQHGIRVITIHIARPRREDSVSYLHGQRPARPPNTQTTQQRMARPGGRPPGVAGEGGQWARHKKEKEMRKGGDQGWLTKEVLTLPIQCDLPIPWVRSSPEYLGQGARLHNPAAPNRGARGQPGTLYLYGLVTAPVLSYFITSCFFICHPAALLYGETFPFRFATFWLMRHSSAMVQTRSHRGAPPGAGAHWRGRGRPAPPSDPGGYGLIRFLGSDGGRDAFRSCIRVRLSRRGKIYYG